MFCECVSNRYDRCVMTHSARPSDTSVMRLCPLGMGGLQKTFHPPRPWRCGGAQAYGRAALSGSPVGLGPRSLRGRDYAGLLHLFVQ